jgi:hypothetical protein
MKVSKFSSAARIFAVAAVPIAMTLATSVAGAQYGSQGYPTQRARVVSSQQELFEWAGRVDREIRIESGRNAAHIINMGSNERNNGGRIRSFSTMPREDGTVTVQVLEGRGKVDVIEQPNSRNGYRAVIRLRDPDGGSARYRIAAYFTPYNNGRYGRSR